MSLLFIYLYKAVKKAWMNIIKMRQISKAPYLAVLP